MSTNRLCFFISCEFFQAGTDSIPKVECLFKKPLTVSQLFVECLDILGKPNRAVYEIIYKYVTDEKEKEAARIILDKSEAEVLRGWVTKDTITIFDLFKKFPSCKPTLEQMIDIVPTIKCRYYSIASSQKYVGMDRLELCVGLVDWTDSAGVKRFGEATGMMSRYGKSMRTDKTRRSVCATIKATAFHLPDSEEKPVIVAGMGTGIAPFRAFMQHKAQLKRDGKKVGPLVVYFGCRYSAKDYLYQDEMEALQKEGVITELKVAFSRDNPKEKFYIQHNIKKDPELFYKRFVQEGGYFYLCGSASQVPIDMRAAITDCIMQKEGWTFEQTDAYVTDMIMKGRYNVEAWG